MTALDELIELEKDERSILVLNAEKELAKLRAALDEARKVIEHVLRADEEDREWNAQELVDWLEANPKETK